MSKELQLGLLLLHADPDAWSQWGEFPLMFRIFWITAAALLCAPWLLWFGVIIWFHRE